MCGEMLSDAVIVERRNGPRRLRANDDDDDDQLTPQKTRFNLLDHMMRLTLLHCLIIFALYRTKKPR